MKSDNRETGRTRLLSDEALLRKVAGNEVHLLSGRVLFHGALGNGGQSTQRLRAEEFIFLTGEM